MAHVTTFLQMIGSAGKILNTVGQADAALQTRSLVDTTKETRVEPLTIVSRDLLAVDYLPEVLQTTLNIFTAYYLQAVALHAQIGSIKVQKVLNDLNPDQKDTPFFGFESLSDTRLIQKAAYKYRLPTFGNPSAIKDENYRIAFEDANDDKDKKDGKKKSKEDNDKSISQDIKIVAENANLGVGKLINVSLKIDKSEMKVPVLVKLAVSSLPNQSIVHLLALHTEDTSLVERFHQWRAGRIDFWRDLMFCQDMIDEDKKALMNDNEGVYTEIMARVNANKKRALVRGAPSLATASNIFILSEESARELELKLGGKLSNFRIREKAFLNTYAMLILVIDRDRERVAIYTRGISADSNVSVKDIKQANKSSSKGPEITDMLRAFQIGAAPTF